MSAYTRQKAKLERASQKQSSDTNGTPHDRVKWCREHKKKNITASERVNRARVLAAHSRRPRIGQEVALCFETPPSRNNGALNSPSRIQLFAGRRRSRLWLLLQRHSEGKTLKAPVRLLASHQDELGSPAASPDFRMWESCRTMPLVGGFSPGSPVSYASSFRRRSTSTSLLRAAQISSLKYRNSIRFERASEKQSSDTHKTQYNRVKRCREREIIIKASERVNVDVITQNKRPCPRHSHTPFFIEKAASGHTQHAPQCLSSSHVAWRRCEWARGNSVNVRVLTETTPASPHTSATLQRQRGKFVVREACREIHTWAGSYCVGERTCVRSYGEWRTRATSLAVLHFAPYYFKPKGRRQREKFARDNDVEGERGTRSPAQSEVPEASWTRRHLVHVCLRHTITKCTGRSRSTQHTGGMPGNGLSAIREGRTRVDHKKLRGDTQPRATAAGMLGHNTRGVVKVAGSLASYDTAASVAALTTLRFLKPRLLASCRPFTIKSMCRGGAGTTTIKLTSAEKTTRIAPEEMEVTCLERSCTRRNGTVVAERLACSPPTKANRVQSPAGPLPDFCMWESCRTMPLVGGLCLEPFISAPRLHHQPCCSWLYWARNV
ncbi:hypothetical protein PR048_024361 [Dryococelus australis]|uniref:Uncharacterized protein n=1 Tax=Dryococelus australis TaxID=614101 RepID=A0ABQ9GND1_9NEOP|nr:hypothetical protein PR048_024361 [Dryococelus australis]